MGAALIKAKGRVSSAVISRPGATANQWTAGAAIIINSIPIREIGGEQKGRRKTLPGSSYHLCRARESGGDGDKHRDKQTEREQEKRDCDGTDRAAAEINRRAAQAGQFCHLRRGRLFLINVSEIV